MKLRTKLKAGALSPNHNQTARLGVRTKVKAGALAPNHNQAGVASN